MSTIKIIFIVVAILDACGIVGDYLCRRLSEKMSNYEERHKKLYKEVWSPDDEKPAKVISYFVKRENAEVSVSGTVFKPPERQYKHVFNTSEARSLLNKKYRSQRFWENNTYIVSVLSALECYIQQAEDGGYGKIILTSAEVSNILPKTKGKK